MNRIVGRVAISAGCAVAIALAGAVPAFAATPAPAPPRTAVSLSTLQARGEQAIDRRLASLAAALARVSAATGVDSADVATITARLSADQKGLTALRAALAADSTAESAAKDVRSIFTTYRVYAVALPQARIALRSGQVESTVLPRLQQAHDAAAKRNADPTQLATMQSDLDQASKDLNGLSAAALAVTPESYNADRSVMQSVRDRFRSALDSVKSAAQIAKSLRGGSRAPSSGTGS